MPRDVDPSGQSQNTGPEDVESKDTGAARQAAGDQAAVEIVPVETPFNIDEEFLSEGTPEAGEERFGAPVGFSGAVDRDIDASGDSSGGSTVPVSELLENGTPVDWREAVAIARRICEAIAQHPSAGSHEYLLDPRHIEISERGEVVVMPGAPGGDPFVKQVGRILRSLLDTGTAPVSLRLLASQAAFEVPGFATVQELSEALRSFESPDDEEAIRAAFNRVRQTRFSVPVHADEWPVQQTQPFANPARLPGPPEVSWDRPAPTGGVGLRTVAVAALAIVVIGIVAVQFARRPDNVRSVAAGRSSVPDETTGELASVANPPAAPPPSVASAPPEAGNGARAADAGRESAALARASIPPSASTLARRSPATAAPVITPEPPAPVPSGEPAAPETAAISPAPQLEALRRSFDALLLADPLYQLDSGRATPAEVAALRESKRQLLPSLARRDYERARAALDLGDYDRALGDGNRVAQMLQDPDFGPVPSGLRAGVQELLALANTERSREARRVYTEDDEGVIAPIGIGRQLPLEPPVGLSPGAVGTLEILIGQDGEVEEVRLHTPLNRYHERMIVSAAKAFRYQPATKDGKPVRFRLFASVNLPED